MAERVLVVVAAVAVAATDAAYIAIIRSQSGPGTPDVLTVPFVASYQLLMALLLVASLIVRRGARPAIRGAAAAGLLVMGWLAAMSVGIPLLIAAALAMGATVLALNARSGFWPLVSTAGGVVLAVALLVVGFEFSWRYLVCPPTGQMSGTTATFTPGQSVIYDCNEGVLTTR